MSSATSAVRQRAAQEEPQRCSKEFNEDFWDEQSGFYAFALDGDEEEGAVGGL